jgi:hypothetical protein
VSFLVALPKRTFGLMECHLIDYGDSGAWVLHDGKLCGHIVGGKGSLSWVYMLPIHQILQEIRSAFAIPDISLPKSANDFRAGRRREMPSPEPLVICSGNEDTITSSASSQPGRKIDDIAKTVTHTDKLSPPTYLRSPIYPTGNPRTYPYGTALGKVKEESRQSSRTRLETLSTTALGSLTADEVNKYIASMEYYSQEPVWRSQKKLEARILGDGAPPEQSERPRRVPNTHRRYNKLTGVSESVFSELRNSRKAPDQAYWIRVRMIVFCVFVIILCLVIGLVIGIELSHRKG